MKKRIISLLLALVMLFSCLSLNVFAIDGEVAQAEQTTEDGTVVENTLTANTDATYTCTVCGGTIDANSDRVCDLCFGELPYGGSLPTDEISKYADSVLFVSSEGKGKGNDPRGAINTVTDVSGNTYTKLGAPKNTTTKTETVFQNFVRTDFSSPYQVSSLNNFEDLKGKSYVISVDMLLFDTLSVDTISVLGTLCYLEGSDGCTTLGAAAIPYFLRILNNGLVQYLDASKGANSYVTTPVNVKDGKFHTFAVHHTPAGDETSPSNTYDAYVDGKLIAKNVQALTSLQNDKLKYTSGTLNYSANVTQITVNGAVDYLPALARTCQITDSTVQSFTDDQFAWDNVKFYYSDTFFEHVHDYEMTHTHDLAASTNEVTYACKLCGLPETRTMSNHSKGGVLPLEKVVALAGESNMLAYGEGNVTSPFFENFARNNSTAGVITVVEDETGNLYVKFGAATNDSGSNDYLEYNGFNSLNKVIKSGVIGKSYVLTLDFMHYGNKDLEPFEIASYTRGTDNMMAAPSSSKTISFKPLRILKDGTLQYRIADEITNYANVTDSNGEPVVLTKGVFYTITVHHIPKDNVFDIYINCKRVASGLKAIGDTDSNRTTWTTSSLSGFVGTEIKMNGAASFTPGYIRTPQVKNTNEKDLFAIDNVKYYRSDVNYQCAHSFVGDTCEWCGKRETITRCEICDGHVISSDVAVVSKSASIGDSIAFNAYVKLVKNAADYGDAKLVLDTTAASGSKKAEFAISELSPETEGENKDLYKITLPLRSIDMTREITLAYEAEGDTNTYPYKTTINDYLDVLLATSQESAVLSLVKAMKNYGSYAQIYFAGMNGNPDDLADVLPNADLSENDRNAIDLVGAEDVADYAPVITGNAVTVTAAKLVLTSHTEMRIYFSGSNNVKAYESVSANGTVTEKSLSVYDSEFVGEYYVTLTEPTPATFDQARTLIFKDGEKQTSVTVSIYSLLYLVLTSTDSTEIPDSFKDLARSLYLLGEETKEYKEAYKEEEHMLNGKKFIFIGNSYIYWGKTVLESSAKTQAERQNDQGYFYQLCKKMGAEVEVTNWTFGGHGVESIFSDECSHCSYDHKSYLEDRYYDYVVISPGAESNFDTTIFEVMDFFREENPDVKFIVMGTATSYGYNTSYGDKYTYQKDLLADFEDQGLLIADWGGLMDGILRGEYTVPNATQDYSINSFIVKDGKHGTMLTGYIQSMLIYSLLTGDSATTLPYDFCLDTSVRAEFDVYEFLSKNTTETYGTNFVEIFNSEADMNGLQQLVDWVLKNKPYRKD